jgi:putative CocE/NonD family hydrolase
MNHKTFLQTFLILVFLSIISVYPQGKEYIKTHYNKHEYRIEMRDGVKLFTAVYSPKDTSVDYPILMIRTPYTSWPYGEDNYPDDFEVPEEMVKDGYIFVFQDVRGRFMSEGSYVNMRPYISDKKSKNDVDESSDTYDTIDWLVKHVSHNNGKVGMWGISYPGFYAAMGSIDAHPALAAVSPEAPIANWFMGDDMHHNGAFSLSMNFDFFSNFGRPRDSLTTRWPESLQYDSPDAYNFFLSLGPLPNVNKNFFHHNIAFWDSTIEHPNYDYYWKAKNNLPHFHNVTPAMLIVGGWYDAEDLYGPLHIYKSIEEKNPGSDNYLVMGPWFHGGWMRSDGDSLGDISFGAKTSEFFQQKMFVPFFEHYLKGKGDFNQPEAYVFQTGTNEWKAYSSWPPPNAADAQIYFGNDHSLSFESPGTEGYDEYLSDPMKPVPYTDTKLDSRRMYNRNYMIEDQRFASERPDVLVYESDPLENNVTISGPLQAELYVSTTGTDGDWVVKIIDEFPADADNPEPNPNDVEMGDYQELVRGEIMRGRYRNSFEKPEPFKSGEVSKVDFSLQDINHTFLKGHRIMIQVQSSWFPFFDRNPQSFVKNIYKAEQKDFRKAEIRLYHSKQYPSSLHVKLLKH